MTATETELAEERDAVAHLLPKASEHGALTSVGGPSSSVYDCLSGSVPDQSPASAAINSPKTASQVNACPPTLPLAMVWTLVRE